MLNAFFTIDQTEHGEVLVPTGFTDSGWGAGMIRGMAVSGALARATEHRMGQLPKAANLRAARFTLDLFRPAMNRVSLVRTEVVRHGRRLALIDAQFIQDEKTVARSATLFLNPTETPAGGVWDHSPPVEPPPSDVVPDPDDERIYFEDGRGWVRSAEAEHAVHRRQSWHWPTAIVEGETPTAFQMAASICDVSNVIANWGDRGLEYINADVTLTMSRLPTELHMGLSADSRVENEGLSVGSAMLYDKDGVFGMSLVTGLANPDNRVDPKTRRAIEEHYAGSSARSDT